MPLSSTVAIIGRPNVGKSTLFNRLVGRRVAVVHAQSGVTRDRLVAAVEREGRRFYFVDTGGISYESGEMTAKTTQSALAAVDDAGLLLFMVDVRTGITEEDLAVARILRPHGGKVWLLTNKVERGEDEYAVHEFHSLGLGEPLAISALNGEGVPALWSRLLDAFPPLPVETEAGRELRLAVVGRPNVGKSSIVNARLGEERMIVSEVPGTTRDAVDSRLRWHGHDIVLVDTAGLRRKARVKGRLELYSNLRSLGAIDQANIVLLVLDADRELAEQDLKIAEHAYKEGKGTLLCVNKWDLVAKDEGTLGTFVKAIRQRLPFLDYAPILFISAKTHQRIHSILEAAWEVYEARSQRIDTSALNEAVQAMVRSRPPHYYRGGTGKLYYATQVATAPPSFVFFVNRPDWIPEHYRRYLSNQLRERFVFKGSPLRLRFQGKEAKKSR